MEIKTALEMIRERIDRYNKEKDLLSPVSSDYPEMQIKIIEATEIWLMLNEKL